MLLACMAAGIDLSSQPFIDEIEFTVNSRDPVTGNEGWKQSRPSNNQEFRSVFSSLRGKQPMSDQDIIQPIGALGSRPIGFSSQLMISLVLLSACYSLGSNGSEGI